MSAVERDVSDLRAQQQLTASDATAARMLAAGADHDVSEVRAELRAHTSALTALRETQLETLGRVDGLEQTVTDRFATVDRGLHQIVTLIEGLSEREP